MTRCSRSGASTGCRGVARSPPAARGERMLPRQPSTGDLSAMQALAGAASPGPGPSGTRPDRSRLGRTRAGQEGRGCLYRPRRTGMTDGRRDAWALRPRYAALRRATPVSDQGLYSGTHPASGSARVNPPQPWTGVHTSAFTLVHTPRGRFTRRFGPLGGPGRGQHR